MWVFVSWFLFLKNKHYLFATSWFTETLLHLYHHSWRGTVLDARMRVDPISAFFYNPMKIQVEIYSKLSLNWYERISMVNSDILGWHHGERLSTVYLVWWEQPFCRSPPSFLLHTCVTTDTQKMLTTKFANWADSNALEVLDKIQQDLLWSSLCRTYCLISSVLVYLLCSAHNYYLKQSCFLKLRHT